jgi:thiol-disulfide isomerase/thioredoxin
MLFFMAMKKCLLLCTLTLIILPGYSQNDSTLAPYKRFPSFPPVTLLLPDSVQHHIKDELPKKLPVMLMIFNPTCEHCQHETEEIIKHISQFKGKQIVMATMMPYDSMMAFRERYKLAQFNNIIVAQDPHFFLPPYYMINSLPFLAFYNKKKELISVFEGSMPIEKALAELKK